MSFDRQIMGLTFNEGIKFIATELIRMVTEYGYKSKSDTEKEIKYGYESESDTIFIKVEINNSQFLKVCKYLSKFQCSITKFDSNDMQISDDCIIEYGKNFNKRFMEAFQQIMN